MINIFNIQITFLYLIWPCYFMLQTFKGLGELRYMIRITDSKISFNAVVGPIN